MKVKIIFFIALILISGCASFKENAKCVAGISTKALEDNRKTAIVKVFDSDYFSCYALVADSLKKMGAYIYAQDIKKHMIAIYVSASDTTPVGIFFKEVIKGATQVEVSSPSSYAKEVIAAKLFSALEAKP
jgi:hypothetical protein